MSDEVDRNMDLGTIRDFRARAERVFVDYDFTTNVHRTGCTIFVSYLEPTTIDQSMEFAKLLGQSPAHVATLSQLAEELLIEGGATLPEETHP